jgi:hypothetical protein
LTEAFKGQDLDFWIDWEGIPPTVDWWKEIQKGIEEADIFLFLVSPDLSKEPQPTDLQRKYVFRSRQTTDRQRRILTGIVIAGVIVIAILSVLAVVQAGRATQQANSPVNTVSLQNFRRDFY